MKKLIIFANFFLFVTAINAQQPQPILTSNPFPKTITVSGSAEMEIIPDEIYVNITLREYQKKGENKKDIETIKINFLESCKAIGLPDSTISILAFTGNTNYYSFKKRKKDPDMRSSITYQLKFKSSELMDKLVEKLDDEATQNFIIASTSHSKMTEFRRQLRSKPYRLQKIRGSILPKLSVKNQVKRSPFMNPMKLIILSIWQMDLSQTTPIPRPIYHSVTEAQMTVKPNKKLISKRSNCGTK